MRDSLAAQTTHVSRYGLKLHETFGIEKMDLPQNNLEGELPPEICRWGALSSLPPVVFPPRTKPNPTRQHHIPTTTTTTTPRPSLRGLWCVDLSDNSLFGSLPRTIGDLSYLKDLNLSGNQLTGELPRELGRLRPLRRLWLQDNQFEGPLPRELGNLFQLREINLSKNKLSGMIPRELGRLEYLERLQVSWFAARPISDGGWPTTTRVYDHQAAAPCLIDRLAPTA